MKCRVRAIIRQGNTLLLVQHKNSAGGAYATWALPGGGIEDGEMMIDALRREMVEETGILPVVGNLLFVHQFMLNGQYEGPEFFFEVLNVEDYSNVDLSKTSHGVHEIDKIGFYDPKELEGLRPEFLKDISSLQTDHPKLMIMDEIA